jgi:hypothetical protein
MPDTAESGDKQKDRGDKESEDSSVFDDFYRLFFQGRAAIWTAVFTGVLTIFTYKMYEVSRIANDTTRSSERAFVSFAGLGIGPRMHDANNAWTGDEIL